ncbi:MAG: XAC2610-related protein [Lutibacter sp.]
MTKTKEAKFDVELKNNSISNYDTKDNVIGKESKDSIPPEIIDGIRGFSYKFNIDSSGYLLKSIIVYSDNIKVQEIIANKEMWPEGQVKNFQLIDWNFDGFKDITVLYNCGSGGCAYWIWNYSPKINKYIYNNKLSEVLGLEIDTISKYIVFHYRAGYSEERWDSLQYINNKLKLVKNKFIEQ